MALRMLDSFDHYVTADILLKWTSIGGSTAINSSAGRRSTQGMRFPQSINYVTKTLDAQATWIVGFSFNPAALPGQDRQLVAFYDSANLQVDLRVTTAGLLIVTRNGTTIGTSAVAIVTGSHQYVEFKTLINNTTGTYEVRLNGVDILSASSQDTYNAGNVSANIVRIGSNLGASTSNWDYDDLYICDGTGGTNDDFLGDCRVDAYAPSGNGNSSQLVGNDANSTDNYLLVDETLLNSDTDYVESATATNKDTYAVTNMSHTPTDIFGVQVNLIAKKDDAGARSIAAVTRSGGADYDGATQALSTSYIDYMEIVATDPNTAAAWTKTNLNAAEFGVKIAA